MAWNARRPTLFLGLSVVVALTVLPAAPGEAAKRRPPRVRTGPCPSARTAPVRDGKKSGRSIVAGDAARRRKRRRPVCPVIRTRAYRNDLGRPKRFTLSGGDNGKPRRTGDFQGKETEELNPELEGYRVPRAPGRARLPKRIGAPAEPGGAASAKANVAAPIVKVFERHHPGLDAWETSGSAADRAVFLTGNWGAWASVDGGNTFLWRDPYAFMKGTGERFCCDQVVQYDPRTKLFIWLLQTEARSDSGPNTIRIAVATWKQFVTSKGQTWAYWDFTPADFGLRNVWMDYSDLAIGRRDLVWSVNQIGSGGSTITRIPLDDLAKEGTIPYEWYFDKGAMHPAQATGSRTWFARENNDSQLRVYVWKEGSATVSGKDVDLGTTIAQSNWVTPLPDKSEGIADTSKLGSDIHTGALTGNEVWFGWSGGRDVRGKPAWKQPHTEIAVIDVGTRTLNRMDYIYSPDHVWVWPYFAVNDLGEVGLSIVWGGNDVYTQYVNGILTGLRWFADVTSGVNASGGHYITARPRYPVGRCFAGFGFGQSTLHKVNDADYTVFGREGDSCDPPPIPFVPGKPAPIGSPPSPGGTPSPAAKANLVVDTLSAKGAQAQFAIKNTGSVAAGPFTVQVVRGAGAPESLAVPNGLQAGATTQVFSSDCTAPFQVTADSGKSVDESDETDNVRSLAACG